MRVADGDRYRTGPSPYDRGRVENRAVDVGKGRRPESRQRAERGGADVAVGVREKRPGGALVALVAGQGGAAPARASGLSGVGRIGHEGDRRAGSERVAWAPARGRGGAGDGRRRHLKRNASRADVGTRKEAPVTHMVIFRSPEGKPGYHQAEGLDAAMRFAEMLRNQEQVTDARIFRMDEVPIEFKTYYRVEMATAAGSGDRATAAGSGDRATAAGSGDRATAAASGEDAEGVTETVGLLEPEAQREPAADAELETDGAATGQEEEPEPVEAAAPGSGRYGLFSRG